ncbi:hypothetical protein KAT80_02435 [Candidatus Pacearchaeota archaeon]|nr:hypothetical protein [Candidatus Pacearchaeota archaeon]
METQKVDASDLRQLVQDVALIKRILLLNEEGEFTEWAKKELAEARKVPDSELLSSEEVKQMILEK